MQYAPSGQAEDADEVTPGSTTPGQKLPGGAKHAGVGETEGVADGVAEGDAKQALAPGPLPLPAGQAAQKVLPAPIAYVFAAHGWHPVAPGAPEKLPGKHGAHAALPGAAAKLPGAQLKHMPEVEVCPAGQLLHAVRPGTVVVVPGKHVRHALAPVAP